MVIWPMGARVSLTTPASARDQVFNTTEIVSRAQIGDREQRVTPFLMNIKST